MKNKTIYTIGHSNRSLEDFIAMLKSFHVETLVDIRSLPGSRKYPQFDKENLEVSLPENQIHYLHLVDLGGRRKSNKESKNTGWRHPAFRGYADYMETESFLEGIEKLEKTGAESVTAYMCSEALWWRCHRALVSDHLKLSGWEVKHIMGKGKATGHTYTSPARIIDGRLSYEDVAEE